MRILTVLAIGLLLASIPGGLAKPEHPEWHERHREVSVDIVPDGASLRSTLDDGAHRDLVIHSFSLATATLHARLVALEPEIVNLEQRFVFDSLQEFHDVDGDGRFSLPDAVVREIPLAGLQASMMAEPNLQTRHGATATYAIPPPANGNDTLPLGGPGRGEAGVLSISLKLDAVQQPTATALSFQLDPPDRSQPGTLFSLRVRTTNSEAVFEDGTWRLEAAPYNLTVDVGAILATYQDGWTWYAPLPAGEESSTTLAFTRTPSEQLVAAARAIAGNPVLFALAFLTVAAVVGFPMWKRLREAP